MKIRICKDYSYMEEVRKSDNYIINHTSRNVTAPTFYHKWEEMDVDIDQLSEMINKGYAIMINC